MTVLPYAESAGILISDSGDVWKTTRTCCKLLSQRRASNGSRQVSISGKTRIVHRMVLETFIGPCPAGCEARHLDGDLGNNRAENLAWTPTAKTDPKKPPKPYDGFPLFAHSNGRWAKKINGKFKYFGPWDDWRSSLNAYERYLQTFAHREPEVREVPHIMLGDLIDRFLADRRELLKTGELAARSYTDYERTCNILSARIGRERKLASLTPDVFTDLRVQLAETRNLTSLRNEIGRIRVVFGFAGPRHLGWVDRDVNFGTGFRRPSQKSLRVKRAAEQPKELSAETIRQLVAESHGQLPAMILLGINCGLGNADCAMLTRDRLDLNDGWLTYPRPKTGIARRAKLWPETTDALRSAWNLRPKDGIPPELDNHWFITRYRKIWQGHNSCPISRAFGRALRDINAHRRGLGFYALRHTFQTVAEASGDFPAISLIMGHADGSMAAVYRERIDDSRLSTVAEVVRQWYL